MRVNGGKWKHLVYLVEYKYLEIELDKCDGASVCNYCSLK